MALLLNLNRLVLLNLQKLPNVHRYVNNKSVTFNVVDDLWDDFTSKILRKTATKLNNNNNRGNYPNIKNVEKSITNTVDIKNFTTNQITLEFQNALDNCDNSKVIDLIGQCIKYKQLPSLPVFLNGISICAENGNKQLIIRICEFLETNTPSSSSSATYQEFFLNNSKLQHYLAEAIWIHDGDIIRSVDLFESVYRNNPYLRRRIRLIIKYLINTSIKQHSEVALLNLIKFSERLLKDYKDPYLLCCIWQACFMSDWYTDQCLALDLLERYYKLIFTKFENRIGFVVSNALSEHRTEIVYRLLEFLLKNELKPLYSDVLVSLLYYHFYWGDKRSCLAILQWTNLYQIELPTSLHAKIVDLLIGKTENGRNNDNNNNKNKKLQRFKYDLRF